MKKYYYVQALAVFIVISLAIFLFFDHINEDAVKHKYYYMWDKVKDYLFGISIAWLIPERFFKLKVVWSIISIFFLIRVIWQVWELENYVLANKPYVIDWLFVGLMIVNSLVIFLPDKAYTYLKNKMRWRK